jgi:4-diphosphocytidyl-2-C-methyl-D-erythritol kinase
VYRASPITEFSPLLESTQADVLSQHIFHGHNALYRNALIKHPVLSEIIAMLKAQNGCITSRISGSGSSCFGIFESLQSLQDAARNINKSHASYQIWEYILDI